MTCPKCQPDNTDLAKSCSNCATRLTQSGQICDSLIMTVEIPVHTRAKGTLVAEKYRILEEICWGGMGVVFKAEDLMAVLSGSRVIVPSHPSKGRIKGT